MAGWSQHKVIMFRCHLELTSGYEKARLQIMISGLSSKQQVDLTLVTRHRRDEVGGDRREAVDSSSDMLPSHLGMPTAQSAIQP